MGDKDTIRAVLDFARKLRDETPPHLQPRAEDDVVRMRITSYQILERERVAANLLWLLEDSGINIHEEG